MKNQLQQETFHQLLLAQRVGLLERMASERGGVVGRAEVAADHFGGNEDSHAQVMTQRDAEFAMNEHETAALSAVDPALARLKAGNYGICLDCDAEIPTTRLLAFPAALRCIDCQSFAEKRH